MSSQPYLRILTILYLLSFVLLLVWWFAVGLLLPVSGPFEDLVRHELWLPVNAVGLVACLLWAVSLPALFLFRFEAARTIGFAGLIVAECGVVLFASIQDHETFLWPVAAEHAPELVSLEGALVFADLRVMIPLVVSGALLALGFLLLAVDLIKRGVFPLVAVCFWVGGVVVFGNGVAIPVQHVGFARVLRLGVVSRAYDLTQLSRDCKITFLIWILNRRRVRAVLCDTSSM